jgi:predicted class III extradiol MEMO1 family dioxygenase
MTRTALELADALDRCQDELLVFGSDFYHPVGEAAHMLRKLHIMDEYAINEIAALRKVNAELEQMKPLEVDISAILHANLDSLYVEDPPAIAKAIRERT